MDSIKSAADWAIDAVSATAQATGLTAPPVSAPRAPDDWLKASEVETIQPDEDEKIDKIAELITKMIDHNFDAHQHKFRGTHGITTNAGFSFLHSQVKSLAFVRGTLTISPTLPPHLQHGLAQTPGATYPVIARYANEPSFILPDTQRAPRGLGLKIFNVPGARLEDDGKSTQDLLFNNAPMVELTDVSTCLEIVELRERHFDSPTTLQLELAKRSDRKKQFAPGILPNTYVVGDTMFTQSSFAYGPYVAHFSLAPTSPAQTELSGQTIPNDANATFHRDHLRSFYAQQGTTYALRAQFASDLQKHPVEDASVEWDEATAPWFTIGTIEFPKQETFSDERRIWWEDKTALSPWDGVVDHKPLGSINRLRKRVYARGRGHRAEGNRVKVEFPDSADEMPE